VVSESRHDIQGEEPDSSSSVSESAINLQNQLIQQIAKRQSAQPVDRPVASAIKGKNQFICAGNASLK